MKFVLIEERERAELEASRKEMEERGADMIKGREEQMKLEFRQSMSAGKPSSTTV